MKGSIAATSAWAMGLCLVAAVSPAGPWSYQWQPRMPAGEVPDLGRTVPLPGVDGWVRHPLSAYTDWHGGAISVIAGVGLLFVLATSPLVPVPWWRALGIALIGAAVLTILLIYGYRHWSWFPVREWGALAGIVGTAGLLFVATLETRQMLANAVSAAGSPTAADRSPG